ncbi:MAG: glycoside hydrolase family 15 protein [Myxococcales bacterium]|nr:glycoside hydrolase family 15 protein [Myxococcales bacterium]MCB9733208.1 glycoside hydrolase family 15 protein [Deltaproteobacteria bacterium]
MNRRQDARHHREERGTSAPPAKRRPATDPRIEDHGLIGNQETAALVARDGAIDFLCAPRFDSPSVFARLLDRERGGAFVLHPTPPADADADCPRESFQLYLADTNILYTRFHSAAGVVEVADFMPCDAERSERAIVRRVEVVRGRARLELRCAPRFDYARVAHDAERGPGGGVTFRPRAGEHPPLHLATTVPLDLDGGDAVATPTLDEGDVACFVLAFGAAPPADAEALRDWVDGHMRRTADHWRAFSAATTYAGRWREVVRRSALVLSLLTSREHGAIVAAPTFGLPEDPGGERNWDYRYAWIRDAAFAADALTRLGHEESARAFMRWVIGSCADQHEGGRLHVMYAVDGGADLAESTLDSLSGYAGSRPVRIGNGAYDQQQLDIYGELLGTAWLAASRGEHIAHDAWRELTRIVDWVAEHWREPDAGIWEVRGGPRRFLPSRVMCWVCLDSALRIAELQRLPAPVERWREVRDVIRATVYEDFWDPERRAFTQLPGGGGLDAAALLMPLQGFIGPRDPRWLATLEAIGEQLAYDAFVFRHSPQHDLSGLEGREGSFMACSFWYVECLALAGRVREARHLFDKLLGYANGVGLFAEELGFCGEQLGNFPQALTHLALVSAAMRLDALLDGAPSA